MSVGMTTSASSPRKEVQSVAVLALGFALVGIDRFLISTMYPVISKDLHLGYRSIGIITGALALAWAFAALLMGNFSDRIGRRRVLVGSLLAFSLLIGLNGIASGIAGLVIIRFLMGLADGAYTPASISATIEASPPEHHGRNIGIQQMTLTLFGLGLAPLAVTALLHVVNWRWVFPMFLLPGLLLTYFTGRVIPAGSPVSNSPVPLDRRSIFGDWRAVLSFSNIRILAVLMLCWLTCLVTTSAFMPSYLMEHLKLGFGAMGGVMSAIGVGAAAGTLTLPWLSDRIGRKPVMLISITGAFAMLIALGQLGPHPALLFAALFGVHFFNNALITLTVGPICSETVPVNLMATASGVIIAVGELFGGGVAPILVGHIAETFSIGRVLWLPTATFALSFLLCLRLKETLPRFAALQPAESAAEGHTP